MDKTKKRDKGFTETEWAIIRTNKKNEPVAAPTIQEQLEPDRGWTYSTVKTIMDRMVKKGYLKTQKVRNIILYRTAVKKDQARKGEIRRTLNRAFDGEVGPMIQCILDNRKVSNEELDEIEKMVKAKKSGK